MNSSFLSQPFITLHFTKWKMLYSYVNMGIQVFVSIRIDQMKRKEKREKKENKKKIKYTKKNPWETKIDPFSFSFIIQIVYQ